MTADDLRQWRERRGLTQVQLAGELGVHEITLVRWERGARAMPPRWLDLALAELDRQLATASTSTPAG